MAPDMEKMRLLPAKPVLTGAGILMVLGIGAFALTLITGHPQRAWQAYLINFLFWSAISQGGLVFSAVMHLTRARWSGSLAGVAEAFSAFFPVSLVLFFGLFLGNDYLFPWLGQDLHGKEVWLNLPFLFFRDTIGLALLYSLGAAYVYSALGLKLVQANGGEATSKKFFGIFSWNSTDTEKNNKRMTVLSVLYILVFALVLSLVGYDLIMAMDPHWYSTLFGGYTFVKAFYVGLGGIIILAAALQLRNTDQTLFEKRQFLDIGRLFLAFCLVWADFFYCQFVVIWYGNIPEETAYIVERVMRAPYNALAWLVFAISFILPFLVLLNRKIKTVPKAMTVLCIVVLAGIWLEHLLLLGPALIGSGEGLPLGILDGVMALGFLGIMASALVLFLNRYPEIVTAAAKVMAEKETR